MRTWIVAGLLGVLPSVALAQSSGETLAEEIAAACEGQHDGKQYSGYFSSRADFARVLFCAGYKYRLTTDAGGIRIDVTPVEAGVQRPEMMDLAGGGGGVEGMGIIRDIMATATGVFEIRPAFVAQGAGANVMVERVGPWKHDKKK